MAVMLLLVGTIVLMAWNLFASRPVVTVVAPPPVSSAPVAPAPGTPPPAAVGAPLPPASKPLSEAELPPREEAAGEKGAEKTKPAHHDHGAGKEKHLGKDKVGGGGEGKDTKDSKPTTVASDDSPKPKKGSLDDLLDNALNKKPARCEDRHASAQVAPEAPAPAGPHSKSAVVAGMNSVKGKVQACYDQFKVPGMAMVNVVIGKSGAVSSATVKDKFAGTPTGACVEKAVKSAKFPPSDGLTTPYPFNLK